MSKGGGFGGWLRMGGGGMVLDGACLLSSGIVSVLGIDFYCGG